MKWLMIAGAFLVPSMAFAQEACSNGKDDILLVTDYSSALADGSFMKELRLGVSVANVSDRSIRMVDGSIVFQDVLGRDILRIAFNPDMKIDAGGTVEQTGIYSNLRLADVAKEDVVISTCIRGLVYDDGEVEKFR
ncbi:hypothetical protein [Falsirhodobacter xinxiangensis]|uniref:hypothetical protein n=1 Tax=Falsirhodobacter xinxiangensis TaxID=2530049 RepID=UPI0010AA6085|nr:hypothetical protein [Rhodobacter xinxiangensis]